MTWSRNATRSKPGSEARSASTQPVTSRAAGCAGPRASAASNARWVLAVAPKLRVYARQTTKATPSIARLNSGWFRKKRMSPRSPPEDEPPPPDQLPEPLELEECDPDELELWEPL